MWVWEFVKGNADALTALFTFIGSIAVVIAMILAIPQLRVLRRNQQLESTLAFLRLMREGNEDREFVYKELPEDPKALSPLSETDRRKVERVIGSLNDVGLLLEEGAIPKKLFFGIYHTMIIRLCYKLQYYVEYHESLTGGRYGRRLERLKRRAELYHDIHPMHRKDPPIMVHSGKGKPVKVYETHKKQCFKGVMQKVIWFFRRHLHIY